MSLRASLVLVTVAGVTVAGGAFARAAALMPFAITNALAADMLPSRLVPTSRRFRLPPPVAAAWRCGMPDGYNMPSRSRLRKTYAEFCHLLPFLYAPRALSSPLTNQLEHVVPRSIIARTYPQAVNDPFNIHMSLGYVNHARGNFRICFDLCFASPAEVLRTRTSAGCIGHGNLVDNKRRLFYPRIEDCPMLARTILRVHDRWPFALREVTISPPRDLHAIAALTQMSTAERMHLFIASSLVRAQKTDAA